MNFTLLVVVLLTAIAFVGIVIALSKAISPRSYNPQKMEAYECGIPTVSYTHLTLPTTSRV